MQELEKLAKQLLHMRMFKSYLYVDESMFEYYVSEIKRSLLEEANNSLILKSSSNIYIRIELYNTDITIYKQFQLSEQHENNDN